MNQGGWLVQQNANVDGKLKTSVKDSRYLWQGGEREQSAGGWNFQELYLVFEPSWSEFLNRNLSFLPAFLFPQEICFLPAFLFLLPIVEENNNPVWGSEALP